eukprot:1156674-Pelagomonas_calceolata.AAC.16
MHARTHTHAYTQTDIHTPAWEVGFALKVPAVQGPDKAKWEGNEGPQADDSKDVAEWHSSQRAIEDSDGVEHECDPKTHPCEH